MQRERRIFAGRCVLDTRLFIEKLEYLICDLAADRTGEKEFAE